MFGMDPSKINHKDPAATLRSELCTLQGWSDDFYAITQKFYEAAHTTLLQDIPMRTYLKHRYASGINVDLLEKAEFPEHRDIWTLNAPRIFRKLLIYCLMTACLFG